ncbi:MAG: putative response regulator, CheY [Pedosphaera sp.]|nr:putative response regulator, CheY [Pedosphaera sp.]
MFGKSNQKHFILIADDSEEDSFFIERALRESTRFQVIGSVRNGEEAIAYLAGQGPYADRQLWPFPHLFLVDLKMPQVDGFKVLEWLRKQNFPSLKVAVLSGSSILADIQKVQSLGVNAFYTKSIEHARLMELVRNLEAFLLTPNLPMEFPSLPTNPSRVSGSQV